MTPRLTDLHADERFDAAWTVAERIEGWLTEAQAHRLWEAARRLPPASTIVEVGSYRGRSAVVLARGAPSGTEVVTIDPHAGNDRSPGRRHGSQEEGEADNRAFGSNIERAGVTGIVRHVRKPSQQALGDVEGDVQLVFIDGEHGFRPALEDIVRWGSRVPIGGTMLLHDSFNAVGVTLAQLRTLVFTRRFRYVGRSGSLSEYRRADLGGGERVTNALRQLAQLGYAAQSIAIKAALRARLRPVARLLGHRSDAPGPF